MTGVGRFCRECKLGLSAHYFTSPSKNNYDHSLSQGDINRLRKFSDNPKKYANGSRRARAKVQYLEGIKHKFNEPQLAAYTDARNKYDAVFTRKTTTYNTILNTALNDRRAIKIHYKGVWRKVDPYALNETYMVGYCHYAYALRTFRIDRILGVELGENFDFDIDLEKMAGTRLSEAPKFYIGDIGF